MKQTKQLTSVCLICIYNIVVRYTSVLSMSSLRKEVKMESKMLQELIYIILMGSDLSKECSGSFYRTNMPKTMHMAPPP